MQFPRAPRWPSLPTALLLTLVFAPALAALDVAKEKGPPAANGNAGKRDSELQRLALRVADWEKSRAERSVGTEPSSVKRRVPSASSVVSVSRTGSE